MFATSLKVFANITVNRAEIEVALASAWKVEHQRTGNYNMIQISTGNVHHMARYYSLI